MISDLTIDVVLTAYKKIDVLQRQIDAIRRQTYRINKMYLFKDGIDSYYEIVLKDSILNQFDGVENSTHNVGVWGRFEYAYNICEAAMVCVFDDDTIPGDKWIENCVVNYSNCPGIYGTNGVIAKTAESYPYDMFNVGWHNPNIDTVKVDFVGHSWFLKREWIKYMLDIHSVINYKYVGEDMALSYACQKNDIYTYVPPHPYNDVQLWGSKPDSGKIYGTQGGALSLNPAHLESMNNAAVSIKKLGWSLLLEDQDYLEKIKDKFETETDKKNVIETNILEYVNNSSDIYLYGAGKYGKIFYKFLKRHNIDIKAFVVSEPNERHVDIDNEVKDIISVDELNRLSGVTVIMSLNSFFHWSVRNKIGKNIRIFPNGETAYSYEDLIHAIE